MNEILILTGACGVGKTSISRKWAELKKGAVIDSDYFTEWIYNDIYEQFSTKEESLVADLTFVTAKEYLKHKMPVAIDGVWTPLGLVKLKTAFENEFKNLVIKCVWLTCELEENHRRDFLRIPEDQMKERVKIVNDELAGYTWPDYLIRIESTHLTEVETLYQIENLI